MPIFVRTKLQIHDDCLEPGLIRLILNYNGPNPQNIYKKVKELFVSIWKAEPSEIQEKNFSWDRSAGTEKFSMDFEVVKDKDRYTYMLIEVSLSGEAKPSKEFGKEGTARIQISGAIKTEYPQDSMWQRSIFYEMFRIFYHKVIYEDTRKKFLEECTSSLTTLQEELKSFLNLLPKSY
jgi:hypothetical protein